MTSLRSGVKIILMKKLSLYIFLVLMWCNNSYAYKETLLSCENKSSSGRVTKVSVIIDHEKKFLNIDGTLTTGSKYKLIEWNEYKIGFIYTGGENSYYQGLDRITGVLSYVVDYNCEKIDKPKF